MYIPLSTSFVIRVYRYWLISSDMEEIVELSDRVMTVCQGRINGEFTGEDINQDNLMAASFGITKNTEVEA